MIVGFESCAEHCFCSEHANTEKGQVAVIGPAVTNSIRGQIVNKAASITISITHRTQRRMLHGWGETPCNSFDPSLKERQLS